MSEIPCFDCGKPYPEYEGERLNDDEFRCFDCANEEKAMHRIEEMDKFIDDPRRCA